MGNNALPMLQGSSSYVIYRPWQEKVLLWRETLLLLRESPQATCSLKRLIATLS